MMDRVIMQGSVDTLDGVVRVADDLSERIRAEAGAASVEHVHVGPSWEKRVLRADGRILARVVVWPNFGGFDICAAWERTPLLERVLHAASRLMGRLRLRASPPNGSADT